MALSLFRRCCLHILNTKRAWVAPERHRAFVTGVALTNVSDILSERQLVAATTHTSLREHLQQPRCVYLGLDPTADSLHLGNLVALTALQHFRRCGHRVVCLIGGATGLIGDPSGRKSERVLLSADQVAANVVGIKQDLQRVFQSVEGPPFVLVDNLDWYRNMSVVDFLRDVGKHFRVSAMLAKDSVKSRLESDSGISFTEFSYQVLQGYDFLHLYRDQGCTVQIGGSDQWGNITAGVDLIGRSLGRQNEVFGLTQPLLTTATGEKFGKSAGNAIWLNPARTSPYRLYQYLFNVADADVHRFLLMFTYRTAEELVAVLEQHRLRPEDRVAQKLLASDVTTMLHGSEGLSEALRASEVFFGRHAVSSLSAVEVLDVFHGVPHYNLSSARFGDLPSGRLPLLDLMVVSGIVSSKGEAKRMVQGGGVTVNDTRISDISFSLGASSFIDGRVLVIRVGKRSHYVITLAET